MIKFPRQAHGHDVYIDGLGYFRAYPAGSDPKEKAGYTQRFSSLNELEEALKKAAQAEERNKKMAVSVPCRVVVQEGRSGAVVMAANFSSFHRRTGEPIFKTRGDRSAILSTVRAVYPDTDEGDRCATELAALINKQAEITCRLLPLQNRSIRVTKIYSYGKVVSAEKVNEKAIEIAKALGHELA